MPFGPRFAGLAGAAVATAIASSLTACQTSPPPEQSVVVKTMMVNGYRMPYVDQGRGEIVVLVHGAVSDYRTWDRQRAALAGRFRVIAYTQRYFGTEPWQKDWPPFGEQTHSDDLAAFIQGLNEGPVHLVAWSYAGQIAFDAALRHPELVRSAFIFEPAVPSFITDAAELKRLAEDSAAFGAPAKAVQAGDNSEATRQLIDVVGGRVGFFDAQPAAVRAIQLDSARTMPLLFGSKPTPAITCAQLGQIKPPIAVVRGTDTRPTFEIVAEGAARCRPSSAHIVVQKANHMWPGEQPLAFSDAVANFVSGQHR